MTTAATDIDQIVRDIASQARAAAFETALLDSDAKNKALEAIAAGIEANSKTILLENKKDLDAGEIAGLSEALIDRLRFDDTRIAKMAEGVRQVASLPDPVGEEIEKLTPPNSLDIRKVRVPIGVIGIIFESRPNVTVDCAVLCLKSGNAAILRGGKEAFHTNTCLAKIIADALKSVGVSEHAVQLIPTTDRAALNTMLKLDQFIHCIIPRGGKGLIRFVVENSTIPVIKHFDGICSIYVDVDADFDMAQQIVVNAKCQRPGVCNAAENLLVHESIAADFLPKVAQELESKGVELRADKAAQAFLPNAKLADEKEFFIEYLDLILSIKVVSDVSEAISDINTFGSGHSDAIVTKNETTAKAFLNGVDAATVFWNASTRWSDGFEFGFGAEIGISTDRLHARGPMGLRELCTYKYMIYGTGQVR